MREVTGDLWAYEGRKGFRICITTNGFIKNNGCGVTGAGVAKQAMDKYPDFPRLLGQSLKTRGNVVSLITPQLMSFPVKHNWWEEADLKLITKSAKQLAERARKRPNLKFVLVRPGCGNGKRSWKEVRPIMVRYFGELDNIFIIEKGEEHGSKSTKGNGTGKAGTTV